MLTKDTQKIREHIAADKRDQALEQKRRDLINDMVSNTVTVESDAGRDVSDLQAQIGRPLTAETVMAKLKRINPRLYFERSIAFPSLYGVYYPDPEGRHTTPYGEKVKHQFGMEAGIMPEFSVIFKAKKKVANPALLDMVGNKKPTRDIPQWLEVDTVAGETRGWRTVLVRLLHDRKITEADISKHFGWSPTHQSKKWQDQTS